MDLQGVWRFQKMLAKRDLGTGMTGSRLTTVVKRIAWRANKSIVLRTIFATSFLLTLFILRFIGGNITRPDCLYSLFGLVGCSETHFWLLQPKVPRGDFVVTSRRAR